MNLEGLPPFRRLPSELIRLIFTLLVSDGPTSLHDLKLVSRLFYNHASIAARSIIYRDIAIKVCRHYALTKSTEEIVNGLDKTRSFHCVRRLIIEESLSTCEADVSCKVRVDWCPPKLTDLRRTDLDEPYEPACAAGLQETPWCPNTRDADARLSDRRNHAWRPVAELIRNLPALTDLFFRCGGQFPACLLDALHDCAPRSRLHLQTFSLPGVDALMEDSQEHRLVFSPALHSIMLQYNENGVCGYDNSPCYRMKTIQRLVKSAPNLKEVQVTRREARKTFTSAPITSPLRKPKTDEDGTSLSPASLKLLRIIDQVPLTARTLLEWGRHTRFSELETLELCSLAEPKALMVWSQQLQFPKLKVLYLQVKAHAFLEEDTPTTEFYEAATHFIKSLPPLKELYFEGWHSQVSVDPLGHHHGCCLRRLDLAGPQAWQCLTERDILQLGEHCPLLESLDLMIPRSQGDATEVALYKAIGTLPHLKYLHLHLDISDASLGTSQDNMVTDPEQEFRRDRNPLPNRNTKPPSEPSFDEFGNEISIKDLGGCYRSRNGHVQRLFRNCAIDSSLASSAIQDRFATLDSFLEDEFATTSAVMQDLHTSICSLREMMQTQTTAMQEMKASVAALRRDAVVTPEVPHPTPGGLFRKRPPAPVRFVCHM
ncbi:NCS1 allantoate transporter [Aspergillus bombycis]|uniref:NCS1 allantoate transporter n=1 Tax=Aspergillus bombycis TaxID=109264 RepID=A0A1F7ZRD2_9EURO|nr:NCS1 allantoate transporter [Aspergillus bombycis]OGM41977.1 NCS1 allantoate transporter [Aspergillus bombycis]